MIQVVCAVMAVVFGWVTFTSYWNRCYIAGTSFLIGVMFFVWMMTKIPG